VNAKTPDTVMAAPERRPAIWPWLVMPLIALTLFYCLDRLMESYGQSPYGLISRPSHVSDPDTL
jgi:hypothetical protein